MKSIGRYDEVTECVGIYREHKPAIHLYDGVRTFIDGLRMRIAEMKER